MSSWLSDFLSWIDDRLGLTEIRSILYKRSAYAGRRASLVFFESFVIVLFIQLVTGICLALYYVPAADHAHTTVEWIQKQVQGGAFVRSLHYWSTSLMLLLLVMHLTQGFISGWTKNRDDLIWILSVGFLLLVFGFAFTGTLLPWDQNGYFSTRSLLRPLRPGTLTLNRFYTLHVMVLPAVAVLLVVFHLLAARRPPSDSKYALYRSFVSVVALATLTTLAIRRPAILEPAVNPLDLQYLPHPGWYFVPIYQFLKIAGGRSYFLIGLVMVASLLFTAPFFNRKLASVSLVAILFFSGGLFLSAEHDDAAPEAHSKLVRQAFLADQESAKPFEPDRIGSSVAVVRGQIPPVPRQFAACAECHGDLGGGGMIGPDLINVSKKYDSSERLEAVLLDPQAHGVAPGQMPRFTDDRMDAFERKALIEYLINLPRN